MLFSAGAGIRLAVLWPFEFVDPVIGETVTDSPLGHSAKEAVLSGTIGAPAFALVSGLGRHIHRLQHPGGGVARPTRPGSAGTPSTCSPLRPLALMLAGMVTVSAVYGFVGVLLGDRLPQLSTATAGGVPVRVVSGSSAWR